VNALLLLLAIHSFPQCGVQFELPKGWTAVVEPVEADDRDAEACDIGIRPPHYAQQLAKTQWDADDPPMTLTVFKVPFDEAVSNAGFEQGERGLGMEGGYGSFATAVEFRLGKWTGWEASTFYRGFAKDGAKLDPEESRVFSGDITHIVVKNGKHIIGLECGMGVFEHPFRCGDAVNTVLRSLR